MSTSRLRRTVVASGFAAAALFAATACSSTTGYNAAATPGASTVSLPPSTGGLATATNATLGSIVTDASGKTLYRSDNDKNIPPTSNCTGSCATMWLPVPAVSDANVKGVDQNLVGSVKRADGTLQVTLGGWPMYTYSGDTAAGDVNGEKVGGVWYAAAPDGTKAGQASESTQGTTQSGTTTTTTSGTGY